MRFSIVVCFVAVAGLATAETREAVPDRYFNTFSHTNAVFLRIRQGDIGHENPRFQRAEQSRPVKGDGRQPSDRAVLYENAETGDAILVHLRKVRMNRNWGASAYRLAPFSVLPEYVESMYPNHYKPDVVRNGRDNLLRWDLDLKANTVRLREPVSGKVKLEFPARPMLGCIGVAAPGDFSPTSGPSGSYGGNLDYNEIVEGATVILPVYHKGGLLFMGDGHAIMADGEPTGSGVETSMDVEFSVEIKKNAHTTGPRVETADQIISLGSQPEFSSSLDRGLQMATTDMIRWLTGDYQIEPWAAHQLIGAVGKYDVVTVAGTMALRIPKKYLK